MKRFSNEIGLQQVIVLRGVVTLLPISYLMLLDGGRTAFVTRQALLCFLRGLAGLTCFTTIFNGACSVVADDRHRGR